MTQSQPATGSIVHLSTASAPRTDKVEFWREVVCSNFVRVDLAARHAVDFSAELKARSLGALRVSSIVATPHSVQARPRSAGRPDDNCFYGVAMLAGGGLFEQDGREAFLLPGDLTFYDATRPHRLSFNQRTSMLLIHVPHAQLQGRVGGVEQCTARRIHGGRGVGAIVSTYLKGLESQVEDPDLASEAELSKCTFELLAAALCSIRPGGLGLSRNRALSLCRVKEFIEQHIADPTLDSSAISAGVGLSPRYVNKLFDDEDGSSSLMRYVWNRRLEHCRRDLQDDAHFGHRVSDIALRWGFNDLSHFSRAFKSRYQVSPREFRNLAASPASAAAVS